MVKPIRLLLKIYLPIGFVTAVNRIGFEKFSSLVNHENLAIQNILLLVTVITIYTIPYISNDRTLINTFSLSVVERLKRCLNSHSAVWF